MGDRDRHDWDRGRDFEERDRDYSRGGDQDRGPHDRGMVSRGADEVRSWFGDDEARRRREADERGEHWGGRGDREYGYGANSERARREHGWGPQDQRPDSQWEPHHGGQSRYGDQRDFVGRENPGQYTQGDNRWRGGSRDFGDEDSRRYGNWRYSGGFTAGQPSPSFSGGYGAGNYESGNYRSGGPGGYGPSPGGFRPGPSGWDNYGGYRSPNTVDYGRDTGSTGEGRWAGQQVGNPWSYPGASGSYSGGTFAGRGPRNYQRSDDRIREDVNERLTADPRIDASDIEVQVQHGEVTLSGMVDERRTRRLAEEVIEDLPGVRDVRNELRVRHRGSDSDDRHRHVGEQSHGREDGAIGHSGDPQKRDDVTTVNAKDARR